MKKKFLCTLLACSIVISTFVLCGANFDLSKLDLEAGSSAQVYIGSIPSAPDTLEVSYALQAVNAQLGHDCDDGYVETLYNAEGQAEYLLAVAADGGYAIYHRITGDLMELGEFGASPYAEQSGTKYYFGPSNYAVKNGTETVDVMRETVMDVSDVQNASSYMSEIRTEVVSNSEIKTYSGMLSVLRDAKEGDVSTASIPTDGTDWSSNPYLNDINIDEFTNVNNYELIEDAKFANTFGNNSHGSCIYISTVLLLRYADYTRDMGIIPNGNNGIPQMWKDYCLNKTTQAAETVKLKDGESSTYQCAINDNDKIAEALHKFLIALDSPEELGYTGWDVSKYASTITSCVGLSNTYREYSRTNDAVAAITTQINANNPVAASVEYYETETNEDGEHMLNGHAVVVYGYETYSIATYFRAHFGWQQSTTFFSSVIFPEYFLTDSVNYLTVTSEHSDSGHECDAQKAVVLDGQIYIVDCFKNEGHQYRPHGLYHQCPCGDTKYHPNSAGMDDWSDYQRNTVIKNGKDALRHFCVCEECCLYYIGWKINTTTNESWTSWSTIRNAYGWESMYSLHRKGSEVVRGDEVWSVCDVCGEEYNSQCNHAYSYSQVSSLHHKRTCSICGKWSLESHTYVNKVCLLCGRKKLL